MEVLIAQINTTPRDFKGNLDRILKGINLGKDCDLVIFPELSIPGYLTKDLIYGKDYVERNLASLYDIVALSKGIKPHIVVGYIDHNRKGYGKPFRNMAAVVHNGAIVATYQKQLLPFYDVFDEGRYFEPGNELTVIEVAGHKFGICICEDVWNDKGVDNYNYKANPLQAYKDIGVKNIISINSSPYVKGKDKFRIDMLMKSVSEDGGSIIYVNQIGGQDELVFDGNSFIVQTHRLRSNHAKFGALRFLCDARSGDCYEVVDFKPDVENHLGSVWIEGDVLNPDHNIKLTHDMLVLGLRDYITKSGFTDVVVGSSGGIDSAVVIALACEAIGPEHVHAIRMPSIYSSEHSKDDARQLHENLGCFDYIVPIEHLPETNRINDAITKCVDRFKTKNLVDTTLKDQKYNHVADENLQARMRGNILMHFSNAYNALLLTTGNKTELALGYCTLYGDMNGGFAPINDCYKLEVYALAEFINKLTDRDLIPTNIIRKAPSAELAPGQTDEASLLPYQILDPIVGAYVEQYIGNWDDFRAWVLKTNQRELLKWIDSDGAKKQYYRMIRMIDRNEFKRRQAAPGIKITKVAFGSGRRLPIVKGDGREV